MKKRMLSLCLALVMVLGLLPMRAWAEETVYVDQAYADRFAQSILADELEGGEWEYGTAQSDAATVTIAAPASFDLDGDGTEQEPFLIKDADDLKCISNISAGDTFSGKYFKLANDITLPTNWTPIGTSGARFGGVIDGDNHTLTIPAGEKTLLGHTKEAGLKNLNIYGTDIRGNGVVDSYTTGASSCNCITIENVTLKSGSSTTGSGFIGGYASGSFPVVIRNCTVEEGVTIGDGTASNIGSFGGDFNGTIIGCKSSATVKGVNFVGGIVGGKGQTMGDFIVIDCIFDGDVIASGNDVGGICGAGYTGTGFGLASAPNTPCATILNCLATGSISGADHVGGILGSEPGVRECWNNGVGYVQNNLFTGTLSATGENKGGVIGYFRTINNMNVVSNNYYLDTCGADIGVCIDEVETRSTNDDWGSGFNKVSRSGVKWGRDDDPKGADAAALGKAVSAEELAGEAFLAALNSGRNSSGNWIAVDTVPSFIPGGEKHLVRISCSALSTQNGVSQTYNADACTGRTLTLHYSDGTTGRISADDEAVAKNYTVTKELVGKSFPASIAYQGHELMFNLSVQSNKPVRQQGVSKSASYSVRAGEAYKIRLSDIFSDPDGDELPFKVKIGSATYVDAPVGADDYYTFTPAGAIKLTFKAYDGNQESSDSYAVSLTVNDSTAPPEPADNSITVSFTLLGDSVHDVGGTIHTLKADNLTEWVAKKTYKLALGTTAEQLFLRAMQDAGLAYEGNSAQFSSLYVSGIQLPGSSTKPVFLREFTNGPKSGWMYTVNGKHPDVGVSLKALSDGDEVVFHYTDDYTKEQGSEDWGGTPYVPDAKTDTKTETSTEAAPTAKVDANGSATAEVSAKAMDTLIENGKAAASEGAAAPAFVVVIKPEISGEASRVAVELPKASVSDLSGSTNAVLAIETDLGKVSISNDALSSIVEQVSGVSIRVSMEKAALEDIVPEALAEVSAAVDAKALSDAAIVKIDITSGSKNVTAFGGAALTLELPTSKAHTEGKTYLVLAVSDDGTVTKMTGTMVGGALKVVTTHLTTFIATTEETTAFTDIENHWAKDAIQYCYAYGLMSGIGNGLFDPNGTVTRAAVVTVLHRLEGKPAATGANPFSDVADGKWYTDAVLWAAENKIVDGYNDKFDPTGSITREQFAVMIYRYASYKKQDVSNVNDLAAYTDAADISDWALSAMQWADAAELITGRTDVALSPAEGTTRAEMASIMQRFLTAK